MHINNVYVSFENVDLFLWRVFDFVHVCEMSKKCVDVNFFLGFPVFWMVIGSPFSR